jgi:hypothetical protein
VKWPEVNIAAIYLCTTLRRPINFMLRKNLPVQVQPAIQFSARWYTSFYINEMLRTPYGNILAEPRIWGLTAAVMKSTNFWDIRPCSLLKVKRRFGRTYRLHLQCRISSTRCQCRLNFNGLHGLMSQKLVLFSLPEPSSYSTRQSALDHPAQTSVQFECYPFSSASTEESVVRVGLTENRLRLLPP